MEPKRIAIFKRWLKPQSIQEIWAFIGFANFYKRFIRNFSAIAGPLTLMLKTSPCPKSSKPIRRDADITTQNNLTPFLTEEAKESFLKLKKTFYKEPILQH